MTDKVKLVNLLNRVGDSVEKDMIDFGLNDHEVQLVETTIVQMKQQLFEKLKRL